MRFITVGDAPPLNLSKEQQFKLTEFLKSDHQRAFDNRTALERGWRRWLSMYQGRPGMEVRNIPFESAPNIEITIGAIAADAIYAQLIDLVTQVKPILTIRSKGKEYDDVADALQDLCNWGVNKNFGFKAALKTGCLDDVQLGKMILYVPWVKNVHKMKTRTVRTVGPQIFAIDPKDIIVPTNCTDDVQSAQFISLQLWLTKNEMNLRRKLQKWKTWDAEQSSDKTDSVGRERLRMSGQDPEGMPKGIYRIMDTFCYFDIDGDGIDEDLEVIWDYTSGAIMKCSYNPWDTRPFRTCSYQDRAHVFYGIGVLEAEAQFEDEVTEIHNARVANMMLANVRGYTGPEEARAEVQVMTPGVFISDFGGEVKPFKQADIYPSSPQAEQITLSLAERRVGVNEITAPSRIGGRTPGISAMSILQQSNRRFAPAFDNARECLAGAVEECVYRFQERVKLGDEDAIAIIRKVCKEKAEWLIGFFRDQDVDLQDVAEIELTASSVSVNRESDRQNMVMLGGLFEKYVQGRVQLQQLAEQAKMQMDQGMMQIAKEGAEALNNIFKRVFRSFDQVSDVRSVMIELEPGEQTAMDQTGLAGIGQQINGIIQQPPQPAPTEEAAA